MTCREFQELAPCLARREPLSANLAQDAEEHRADCPACRQVLENEEALSTQLRAFAASRSDAVPPKRVEALLRQEFARKRALAEAAERPVYLPAPRENRRTLWMAAAIGALAATVALLVLFITQSRRIEPSPVARVPVVVTPSTQVPVAPADEAATVEEEAPVSLARSSVPWRGALRSPAVDRAQQPDEQSAPFLPLATPVSARDLDGAEIIRVRLSRTGLAALGIPMVNPGSGGSVVVDVLIGQDGTAKAIRFVR